MLAVYLSLVLAKNQNFCLVGGGYTVAWQGCIQKFFPGGGGGGGGEIGST